MSTPRRAHWFAIIPSHDTVITSIVILAIGGYAVFQSFGYGLGTPNRIGSGAFPLAIGLGLIALAVVLLFVKPPLSEEHSQPIFHLGFFCVSGAMLSFIILIETLGLALTIAIMTFISAAADRSLRLYQMLLLSVFSSILCTTIFIYLINIRLKPFWW